MAADALTVLVLIRISVRKEGSYHVTVRNGRKMHSIFTTVIVPLYLIPLGSSHDGESSNASCHPLD